MNKCKCDCKCSNIEKIVKRIEERIFHNDRKLYIPMGKKRNSKGTK